MSAFLFQKLLSGTLDAFDGFLYVLPQDEAILHAGKHVVGNEQRDRGRFRRGRGFAVFRQHLPAQSHAPAPISRITGQISADSASPTAVARRVCALGVDGGSKESGRR